MKAFFILALSLLINSSQAKVYDCFLFFNELDLLEVRLNELQSKVDHFVLVESCETFRGLEKPFYYEESKKRFEKFADKIIHVKLEDKFQSDSAWKRESYQRNQIMRGLKNCKNEDLILVSDVDEIPRASSIDAIRYALTEKRQRLVALEQTNYRYFMNTKEKKIVWAGTSATFYKTLKTITPDSMRSKRKVHDYDGFLYYKIPHAGWHFTSIGGLEKFKEKLAAFSHAEWDIPEKRTREFILNSIQKDCEVTNIDSSYPEFILNHLDEFIEKGYFFQ